MSSRKENRPLQWALGGSRLHSATHTKQSSTQAFNTLPRDSVHQPQCIDGRLVPVARYLLDDGSHLSSFCICYDIRDEGTHPLWLNVHISEIPPRWLKGLPIVSRIDEDLLLDPVLIATLEQLRGFGWLKSMQKIIAWVRKQGHPQAEYWALVYAEEKLWGALYDDAH